MERDEKQLGNEEKKEVPCNPNQQITDEEINEILKKAAKQIAEKEEKKPEQPKPKIPVKEEKKPEQPKPKSPVKEEVKVEQPKPKSPVKEEAKVEQPKPKGPVKEETKPGKPQPKLPEKEVDKSMEKRVSDKRDIDEMLEDEPFVVKNTFETENPYKEKITVGRVIGTFFETVWTVFKLAVLVIIVTGVAGFFLSRDMMIRGRNGNRQSTEGMMVSANVAVNKSNEQEKLKKWKKSITKEKITLTADDNRILVARKIVVNEDSNKWAVILHGYNESMTDVYDIAMHYTKEGYNVLLPDLRAHGESEGSFLGMGWLDRLDIINWIDVILKEYSSADIVIHGVDIGADTALMLSGEPLKSSIKAIVAEGAYTSAWDVVKLEYKARHEKWPVFPLMNMMNPVMKVWAGYSLKEADAVKQVKSSNVPILLIHGENDTYATGDMTEKLDQTIASEHEVFTVPTGTHGDCRYAEPDNYYNKTFEFVGKYVK